jgi:hypothetical protein
MHRRPTAPRLAILASLALALACPAFAAPRPAPSDSRAPRVAAERPQALVSPAASHTPRTASAAPAPAPVPAPSNFKITYKNCTLSVGLTSTVSVTNADAAVIKIQKLKKAPANPTPIPGKVAYLLNATGITDFGIDGDVLKFSSTASIGFLHATGRLNSVTTTGAFIETMQADIVGTVKQQANARTDSANEVFSTAIYAGDLQSQGVLRPGAPILSVTLTGVSLFEVIAPEQTAWMSLASKKWRNPFGQRDLSLANVPFATDNVIEVGDLWQIKTKGGAIVPSAIIAAAPINGGSLISGAGILFVGSAGPTIYDGTVWPDLIDSRATGLTVISTGGDVRASLVVADGEIARLLALHSTVRLGNGITHFGGELGLAPATTTDTMHVVSGADTSLSAADIGEAYGSVSVRGDFFAGGDDVFGTLLSAALGLVGTDDPSVFPADPTITGNGWSSQTIQFIGGDHSGFVEQYP